MSWPVDRRRFRQDAAAGILGRNEAGLGRTRPGDDRLVAERHGGQQTSRGLKAAIDLTAATRFEPGFGALACATRFR
jgi:hypothetical protein